MPAWGIAFPVEAPMKILEIPYLYRARVTLPRKRNESLVLVRDTVPVQVDEVPASEAPVAVEMLDDGGNHVAARYRSYGGGLVEPHLVKTRVGDTIEMRPASATTLEGWFRRGAGSRVFQTEDFDDVRPLDGDERVTVIGGRAEARLWHWDDKISCRADVVRRSRRAVLVGDRLHFASTGPVCHLKPSTHDREVVVEWSANADSLDDECWRCDRADEAIDAARALAAERGWQDVREAGGARILSPGAVTWDDDFANLGVAARELVSETGWCLQRWPTDAIVAWARLRDAMVAWPSGRDAAHAEVARNALQEITARGLQNFAHERRHDWDPALMRRALQRCDLVRLPPEVGPAP
jgi:hypothetical protein